MEQLLARFPKAWLLTIVLVGGVFFFFMQSPPHSPCDSQKELFFKSQEASLKSRRRDDDTQKSRLTVLADSCKAENSSGGCEPYFRELRKVVKELKNIPEECNSSMGEEGQLIAALSDALRLMTQLAWGFSSPLSSNDRTGWLEPQDVILFCQLRGYYSSYTSPSALKDLLKSIQSLLPETGELELEELWRKSLLGLDCSMFKG